MLSDSGHEGNVSRSTPNAGNPIIRAMNTELRLRHDVVKLANAGGVGIELGVAEGVFAERALRTSSLSFLYGVDMYAGDRCHDVDQYRRALARLMPFRTRHALIRMRFDEALELFDDEHFDFIYVDGYAHTGEEEGRTLEQWFPKLKPGGIFAGDDYSGHWPKVVEAVDRFAAARGLVLNIIDCAEPGTVWSEYPTWWARKPAASAGTRPELGSNGS